MIRQLIKQFNVCQAKCFQGNCHQFKEYKCNFIATFNLQKRTQRKSLESSANNFIWCEYHYRAEKRKT